MSRSRGGARRGLRTVIAAGSPSHDAQAGALIVPKLAAALALACAAVGTAGLASGCGSAPVASGSGAQPRHLGSAGRGGNARSAPAAGGASGSVTATSGSGFTLTTSAGRTVTVRASPSGVKTTDRVLVLGTVNGTTITASRVILHPAAGGSAPAWAGTVIPFRRGAPSAAKSVGRIPAGYEEGSGTIVSGATAANATRAALAVYPGGIVDRVVRLSSGELEVHNIGVNWPHHIFVSRAVAVVGAD